MVSGRGGHRAPPRGFCFSSGSGRNLVLGRSRRGRRTPPAPPPRRPAPPSFPVATVSAVVPSATIRVRAPLTPGEAAGRRPHRRRATALSVGPSSPRAPCCHSAAPQALRPATQPPPPPPGDPSGAPSQEAGPEPAGLMRALERNSTKGPSICRESEGQLREVAHVTVGAARPDSRGTAGCRPGDLWGGTESCLQADRLPPRGPSLPLFRPSADWARPTTPRRAICLPPSLPSGGVRHIRRSPAWKLPECLTTCPGSTTGRGRHVTPRSVLREAGLPMSPLGLGVPACPLRGPRVCQGPHVAAAPRPTSRGQLWRRKAVARASALGTGWPAPGGW